MLAAINKMTPMTKFTRDELRTLINEELHAGGHGADELIKMLAELVEYAFIEGFNSAPGDYYTAAPWQKNPKTAWENSDAHDELVGLLKTGA